jgi:hypothetical protein
MVFSSIPADRLPGVVLGRDPGFARPEAFAVLAASDLPNREELLAVVLDEAGERADIRTAAAVALGRVATAESEHVLLANLSESTPRVLAEITRSLGRIGTQRSLARVDELVRSADPRVTEAARFGAALIAHRLGLPGHELPMPAESELLTPPTTAASRPIDFRPEPPEKRALILADLRRYPFQGIEYDEDSITGISCAGAELALALNREISATSDRLFQRKALAGVVALRSPETGDYSASLVVLTAPADGAVNAQLTTNSGQLTLAGQARRTGTSAEFALRSVARPGALAMLISGALDGRHVAVTQALSGTVRERSRLPERVPRASVSE